MSRLRAAIVRLAALFGLGRTNAEISEEIRIHVELQAAEFERSGLTRSAARRAALVHVGSIAATEDAYRDRRGLPRIEHWLRDLRYAVRSLGRSSLLTVSVIVVLASGIGASTAIVTMLHATVWRPLPVRGAEQVVKLSLLLQGKFSRHVLGSTSQFSYPEFQSYRDATRALSGVAAVQAQRITWRSGGEPRSLAAALVSGRYFDVLRVQPARGRLLSDADAREAVVVIGARLWQEAFDHDPDVVGRTLNLDRFAYTVVGVAEPGFGGTDFAPVDLWLPLEAASLARGNSALLAEADSSWLQLVGRLAGDQSVASANAEAAILGARFDAPYPGRHSVLSVTPASLLDAGLANSPERINVFIMYGAVAGLVLLLLLLSASNAAGLLLARGASRRKEIAVRIAIGAGRGQIVRQLLVESAVIATSSAALGLLLCTWILRGLTHWLPLQDGFEHFIPDGPVFAFAAVFAGVTSLLIGVGPALQARDVDVLAALKGGAGDVSAGTLPLPAFRLRHLLISAQTAVSAILLIISALLARGIDHAARTDPGFTTAGVFIVSLDPSRGYAPVEGGAQRAREFRDRLARTPGLLAVGAASVTPFRGHGVSSFRGENMPSAVTVSFNAVDDGYFRALGVAPVAGHLFGPHPDPNDVLVNDVFARTYWRDAHEALGRSMTLPGVGSALRTATVVGVIPTLQSVTLGVPDGPTYYSPLRDERSNEPSFLLHATPGTPVERLVRVELRSVDPDGVASIESMSARITASTMESRVMASVGGLMGLIALVMAAVGIHGLVAYSVACRTREISVHVALGAPRASVMRLVLRSSLRAAATGALIGGALVMVPALALSRVLAPALFGLSPVDPAALLTGAAVLTSVIFIAAYLPARRALDVRPIDALRQDG